MSVHNNYYTCYYNNNPSQLIRTSLFDKWDIHFNECFDISPIASFKEETLRTCELIYERFKGVTPVLNLFFSGGTDSECLLRCFNELEIPVNPIILVHRYYPRSEETILAFYICKSLGITPRIIEMDLHKLYSSGICYNIGLKYQTTRLGMIELLYAFEKVNEPCIISDDIQLVYQSSSENMMNHTETKRQQWFYEIKEDIDGVYDRYEYITGIPVVADPLKYTSRTWAAMLTTHNIKDIVLNNRGKSSSNTTKNIMMSKEFGIQWRDKSSVFANGYYRYIASNLVSELSEHVYPATICMLRYSELLTQLGAYEQ